jgi:SAM-dependent methyltransferase
MTSVGGASSCESCGLEFTRHGDLLDILGLKEREQRAAGVEAFYTVSPFPGYAPGDDAGVLLDRCRLSPYLAALDAAIPPDATVLDVGCGTAQIPAFLALAAPQRRVIGIDGCKASLAHAEEFRLRAGIQNLQLVRADIFDLPVNAGAHRWVLSRGVVHHTPDPWAAIECVARCVAPGGHLVLGFYETWGRAFHCARRGLSKLVGRPLRFLDPILKRTELDEEKKRIWIDDQYRHPLEHILAAPRVQAHLRRLDFRWVRSVPPLPPGLAGFFEATAEPRALSFAGLRLGWMLAGVRDPDAGLVALVARRQDRS